MAQGDDRSGTEGKNCIFVMTHDHIAQIWTKGKEPTYTWVVVDFRPQKEDPNRVRITAGGNLIKYAKGLTCSRGAPCDWCNNHPVLEARK